MAIQRDVVRIIKVGTYFLVDRSFRWVFHDSRRLHWEVGDILVFHTISHVELAPLSLPEVGHLARPDHRLDDNDAVLLVAMGFIGHSVSHLVAVRSKDPCRVAALASFILTDRLESVLIRVSSEDACNFLLLIFSFEVNSVGGLVVAENVLGVMNPA